MVCIEEKWRYKSHIRRKWAEEEDDNRDKHDGHGHDHDAVPLESHYDAELDVLKRGSARPDFQLRWRKLESI